MRIAMRTAVNAFAVLAGVGLVGTPVVSAQVVEVAPYGGYRFGGDVFEAVAGRPLDLDGAPAVGVVLDVPLSNGLQFEGLFSHQEASVLGLLQPFGGPPARWRVSVDHWQGGGLQEFGGVRARPFLTGMLGLTRYAAQGDSEIRFTLGAGGGVKLFPLSHVGVRLDGRAFATFLDADARTVACNGPRGTCFFALNVNVVWQAEFTAGLLVRFR
jgi:hypothetical protein